jgi:hypothetical protein
MRSWKIGLGGLFVLGFLFVMGTTFTVPQMHHREYQVFRAEGLEDGATFAAGLPLTTAGDFANREADTNGIQLTTNDAGATEVAWMELIICGGDAANDTLSFAIVAYRKTNGPAEVVCTATAVLGTQAVVKYPHNGATATSKFWADTMTVTNYWPVAAAASDSGNNRVAKLRFPTLGREWFIAYVYDADGTSTEAEAITFYWAGYPGY